MSQTSIISFRVTVPNNTQAAQPLRVLLDPMSPLLRRVVIGVNSTADFSKCGFRLSDTRARILPDNGSKDSVTLSAAGEDGWSPLFNHPVDLCFGGRRLDGAPFTLTLDLYNTTGADLLIGGFVETYFPELTLSDFLKELTAQMKEARPVVYAPEVKATEKSDDPRYPVMQQGKK